MWRPHRPYEGSQRDCADDGRRRRHTLSSSPLRGVATRTGLPALHRSRVLIAPTRGRNATAERVRSIPDARSSSPLRGVATPKRLGRRAVPPGPHRPYEGSQLRSRSPRHRSRLTCPHRPYEGSQQNRNASPAASPEESSSPLRGVATPVGDNVTLVMSWRVLIAPTRGRNKDLTKAEASKVMSSSPLRGVATRHPHLVRW